MKKSLIQVYPYLILEDMSEKEFEEYKKYVYSLEYEDLAYNYNQCRFLIETESLELLFQVGLYLTYHGLKWKIKNSKVINNKNSVYRINKYDSNDMTGEAVSMLTDYSISIRVDMKYNEYKELVKIIVNACKELNLILISLKDQNYSKYKKSLCYNNFK